MKWVGEIQENGEVKPNWIDEISKDLMQILHLVGFKMGKIETFQSEISVFLTFWQ